jgi:hypothetical protein
VQPRPRKCNHIAVKSDGTNGRQSLFLRVSNTTRKGKKKKKEKKKKARLKTATNRQFLGLNPPRLALQVAAQAPDKVSKLGHNCSFSTAFLGFKQHVVNETELEKTSKTMNSPTGVNQAKQSNQNKGETASKR